MGRYSCVKIEIREGLPFITILITYGAKRLALKHVLLDTGSYSTIVSTDRLHELGLIYEPNDQIHQVRGVGGTEFVFTKHLELMELENKSLANVPVEVGSLDYGFELDGIMGMDLFIKTGAVIDLENMELRLIIGSSTRINN